MSLGSGDDVFVKSKQCCGEVIAEKQKDIYEVERDIDSSRNNHHVDDLIKFPLKKKRIYYQGFMLIVDAVRDSSGRIHKSRCYRDGGGRIY